MFAPYSILAAIVGAAVLAAPVSARGAYAGGVDMEVACHEQYGNDYDAYDYDTGNAFTWFCLGPNNDTPGVDVDQYCKATYGADVYADSQGGGKYDWGCYYIN